MSLLLALQDEEPEPPATTGSHYYRLLLAWYVSTAFVQSEATAARRRFPLYLVDATDGITAETGEAAGQPQVSKNGAAWGNTTATLTAVGNGKYYVELTAAELSDAGAISVRYKSANTAEFSADAPVAVFNTQTATPTVNATQWAGSATATDDIALKATLAKGTDITGFNDLSAAQVNTECDTALTDYDPPTQAELVAEIDAVQTDVATRASQVSVDAVDNFVDAEIADIQARLPAALVGGRLDASVGAIAAGAITAAAHAVGAIDAAALATDAGQEIADRVIARNVAGGSDTGRTVKQALGVLRNKVTISAGTLTVFDTDDVTPLYTAAVTTAAGNPLSAIDPA